MAELLIPGAGPKGAEEGRKETATRQRSRRSGEEQTACLGHTCHGDQMEGRDRVAGSRWLRVRTAEYLSSQGLAL